MTSILDLVAPSVKGGLGWLLQRPVWANQLPEHVRGLALAEYRDGRIWTAGKRERAAALNEARVSDPGCHEMDVPLLVITAGQTAAQDSVQKELHDEYAAAAPRSERHVLDGVTQQQLQVDAVTAHQVAKLVGDFVLTLEDKGRHT